MPLFVVMMVRHHTVVSVRVLCSMQLFHSVSSSTSSCSLREVLSKTNTWRVSCSVLDLNVQKISESLPGKGKG